MHIDRRFRARIFVASALATLSTAIYAAEPPPAQYCEVTIDFSIDGKHVAAPSAIVAFGEEAEVTIGNPDEHAWRLRILAGAPAIVHRVNVIPVSIALDEIAKGEAYAKASPELRAVPGQRADIETIFGDGDGRHAHLAVVANPRSDAAVQALRKSSGDERN